VTDKLLPNSGKSSKQTDSEDLPLPDKAALQKLNQAATQKLAEIVRRNTAGEKQWQGYDPAEIEAARELLAEGSSEIIR
jgi:ER membrane protein complex subunit 2